MIKAIVFDLDGVFFENGTETFINSLQEKYHLEKTQIKDVYFKSQQMQDYKKGKILGDEYWAWATKTWKISATKKEIIDLLINSYSVKEQTKQYVENLRSRGIKTAICTNNFPERLNGLKEKFSLNEYFDTIVASFEVGITKPSPEIFEELSKQLDCKHSEIIMSDDKEDNVLVLKQLGFNAILYKDWETFVNHVENIIKRNLK
ncbi:MAG: HAD family hydrolase [Candidatus Dojkabacteria bacterium]|jgi:putative hydrolase of the HAD superfamily